MRTSVLWLMLLIGGCTGVVSQSAPLHDTTHDDDGSDDGSDVGDTDSGHADEADGDAAPNDDTDTDRPPFVPPQCAVGTSTALPADAPTLSTVQWTNISPPGPTYDANATSFTQGMTIDPCNPATLYVCSRNSEGGLYRSLNGGADWTEIGDFQNCINVRVDPEDPLHLYMGAGVTSGNDGFWVSYDGGESWAIPDGYHTIAHTTRYDVYHVSPDPGDFQHVLLSYHYNWEGYGEHAGVAESFDGGENWEVRAPLDWGYGGAVLFLYEPTLGIGDSDTWLFGSQGSGYFRTTNGGDTWAPVSTTVMTHGGASLYYAASGTVYVTASSGMMRSTDNGEHWTSLSSNGPTLGIVGDGTHLYTGQHGGGHFRVALENDDTNWSDFNSQTFYEGPFELVFDKHNRIIYSANIRAGVWALKVE